MTGYEGKTILRFEDEFGRVLDELEMLDDFAIVFTDGSRCRLLVSGYGGCGYANEVVDERDSQKPRQGRP